MYERTIKRIRETLMLTQQEFAKLVGVSRQTVAFWETGVRGISLKNSRKIVEICHKNNIEI